MNLTRAVKEQAYRLGFSLVGVTTGEPLPHAEVFENWLKQGRQGEMAYLETSRSRENRAHPAKLLPGCRSVLVLGTRYPSPVNRDHTTRRRLRQGGRVAAYAWGEDYHDFLPGRLKKLVAFIETQIGQPVVNRYYTDTGPLLERELAQRAGLGWIGKNTCLINPDEGSYSLLAEILLGIELEADHAFEADRCGTCMRCIQACPTSCILPDRTLDARRCISYLSIELKGVIPVEQRPLMGNWVFGCDVCQQVCPWNRFAGIQVDPAFEGDLSGAAPDLLNELLLSTTEFNRKFRHSPIRRAKRRGYLRNVAVALGNLGDSQAVSALAQAMMHDPEPLVRAHSAWALAQIGELDARRALEAALAEENEAYVRQEIERSLAEYN